MCGNPTLANDHFHPQLKLSFEALEMGIFVKIDGAVVSL
jgi:hypothetical protein